MSPELQVLSGKQLWPTPPCPTVADPQAAMTVTPMERTTALDVQLRMRGSYLTTIRPDDGHGTATSVCELDLRHQRLKAQLISVG